MTNRQNDLHGNQIMKDYIDLGSTPIEESCIQLGHEGAREECDRYRDMCRTIFPQATEFNVRFITKSNSHDFGAYYEVNAVCDDRDEQAMSYAFWCQDNQPMTWTDTEPRIMPAPTEEELLDAESAQFEREFGRYARYPAGSTN